MGRRVRADLKISTTLLKYLTKESFFHIVMGKTNKKLRPIQFSVVNKFFLEFNKYFVYITFAKKSEGEF